MLFCNFHCIILFTVPKSTYPNVHVHRPCTHSILYKWITLYIYIYIYILLFSYILCFVFCTQNQILCLLVSPQFSFCKLWLFAYFQCLSQMQWEIISKYQLKLSKPFIGIPVFTQFLDRWKALSLLKLNSDFISILLVLFVF